MRKNTIFASAYDADGMLVRTDKYPVSRFIETFGSELAEWAANAVPYSVIERPDTTQSVTWTYARGAWASDCCRECVCRVEECRHWDPIIINLTPHPVRIVRGECPDEVNSLDGWVEKEIPSSGAARLAMKDHGAYVVYGHPTGMPTGPTPGHTYVVSLTVALNMLQLGWPSYALRVPSGDIRLTNGTRAGACRRLVEPRTS